MREELLKFFEPRSETLELAGATYTVRTMPEDADREAFRDNTDSIYKFATRSVFDAAGKPAFTDDDIAVLKSAPAVRILPLIRAVERVNGLAVEEEIKNSEAGPSAG